MIATRRYSGYVSNTISNSRRIKMKKMLLAFIAFLSFSLSAFAAVNINPATQAELETLDGVGPVKAQAIIDYRKKLSLIHI